NLRLDASGTKTLRFSDGGLSTVDSGSFAVSPLPASTLQVSAGTSQTAGTAFDVTVTARDPYNNVATGYLGTVHFTSSDGSAALPSNYTFVAGDNGVRTFTTAATLKQAGAQNVIATDTVTGSITGTQSGISVAPGA